MAQLARIRLNWTGFVGAPGYTNLYFRDPSLGDITQTMVDAAVTSTDTWLDGFAANLPPTVSLLIDPTVDVIEDLTGTQVNLFTGTPDTSRTGAGTGTYSAATGLVVNWKTANLRNGRKIRGRTFIVPLAGTTYDAAGSIDNTKLTTMRTAAATFISGFTTSELVVWCRPTTIGGSDGTHALVTSSVIPDKVAILSSRRD